MRAALLLSGCVGGVVAQMWLSLCGSVVACVVTSVRGCVCELRCCCGAR